MAIWTATKTARVIAIAGTVRRTSIPAVTPSAKAKAAYAIGTMPRAANNSGSIRWKSSAPALSSGLDHQSTARLPSPAAVTAARATRPSLTASQRVRVTLWFHTSRCVPASSSRAISGAPQKSPIRAGRTSTTAVTARNALRWSSKNRWTKSEQPSPWVAQPAIPAE